MESVTPLHAFSASFPFADEKETMDAVNGQLLEAFGRPEAPEGCGIYLISANAGFYSSVAFWEEVLDKGPGLANPERFPWTLANAPCGAIARAFGITGPNYTFNGSATDLPVVLEQIGFDLAQQVIDQAWLIAIDFGKSQGASAQLTAVVFRDLAEVENCLAQISRQAFEGEANASEGLKKGLEN